VLQRSNKTALSMAKHFYFGNYTLTLIAVVIFAILNILSQLLGLVLGLFFSGALLILVYSAYFYFAHYIPTLRDPQEMEDIAQGTTLSDLFFQKIAEGTAAFLGFLTIAAILSVIGYFLALAILGDDLQKVQQIQMELAQAAMAGENEKAAQLVEQLISLLMPFFLTVLIIGSFFSYVMMGVWGRVLKGQGFAEPYLRVFLAFWPGYWIKTFKLDYLLLTGGWFLISMLIGFLYGIVYALISYLFMAALHNYPLALMAVMVIFSSLLTYMVVYFIGLYTSAVAWFADDIAMGEVDG